MATLLLSQGVPMILAGDEFLRTQQGNNNAWCQDNEISWVDWRLAEKNADFLRFMRMLIALRKRHPALRRRAFFRGAGPDEDLTPDIFWHGVEPDEPAFTTEGQTIAYTLDGRHRPRARPRLLRGHERFRRPASILHSAFPFRPTLATLHRHHAPVASGHRGAGRRPAGAAHDRLPSRAEIACRAGVGAIAGGR